MLGQSVHLLNRIYLEIIFEFGGFHGLEDGCVGAVEADLVVEVGGGEGEEEAGPVDQDGPGPGLEGDHLSHLVGPLERREIIPGNILIRPVVHLHVFPPSFLVHCTNLLLCPAWSGGE